MTKMTSVVKRHIVAAVFLLLLILNSQLQRCYSFVILTASMNMFFFCSTLCVRFSFSFFTFFWFLYYVCIFVSLFLFCIVFVNKTNRVALVVFFYSRLVYQINANPFAYVLTLLFNVSYRTQSSQFAKANLYKMKTRTKKNFNVLITIQMVTNYLCIRVGHP